MPRVCKEDHPTEPFPKSDRGTRSEKKAWCAPRVRGGFLPSRRRDAGWDSGHCGRSFEQGPGLGHQAGVGLEGHQGQGLVRACEAAGHPCRLEERRPGTRRQQARQHSCGAVEDAQAGVSLAAESSRQDSEEPAGFL